MFDIDAVEADYTKFSNNTEKVGKSDKFASGWTLPLEFHLTIEQAEAAFARPYLGRLLFDTKKGEKYSAWKNFAPVFYVTTEYDGCAFSMTFVGGKRAEWDDKVGFSKIEVEPIDGGRVRVACHAYVHPNTQQKKLLDEFQHSKVTISVSGGTIASKKQREMFDGEEAKPEETATDEKKFEDAAKAQRDAWNKGRPVGGLPESNDRDTH